MEEAWKATTCDTLAAFLPTSGDRKAERQVCLRRGDWRAMEAIVDEARMASILQQ